MTGHAHVRDDVLRVVFPCEERMLKDELAWRRKRDCWSIRRTEKDVVRDVRFIQRVTRSVERRIYGERRPRGRRTRRTSASSADPGEPGLEPSAKRAA